MTTADLRTRLARLRAQTASRRAAAAAQAPTPETSATPVARPAAQPFAPGPSLPGERVATPLGAYQLIETRYALDCPHGPRCPADLLAHQPLTAARLARDEALARSDLGSLAFLDTETTGLGGTGTLVFLVGVGRYDGDAFVLRQYFLLDPADEPALLAALLAEVAPCTGWVTYNGRAFDLPLLEGRFTLNRQRGALGARPNLDLLMPARRLFRGRIPSCSLGDVEQHVFRITREQADVPGWLIPQLYTEYLRTQDPREMRRVIYHNTVDILSMVTLAAHLLDVFSAAPARPAPGRSPADLLRLALWHDDQGRPAEAEEAYFAALASPLELDDRALALRRLAQMLKRQNRRAECLPLWKQLAAFTLDDAGPMVELAKHYEWHAHDLAAATAWAERALALLDGLPASGAWQRSAQQAEVRARLARLEKKARREAGV